MIEDENDPQNLDSDEMDEFLKMYRIYKAYRQSNSIQDKEIPDSQSVLTSGELPKKRPRQDSITHPDLKKMKSNEG